MALANLAVLFFRRPLDVIVVDWDLEAPGIERYLADRYSSANPGEIASRRGLCDLMRAYRSQLVEPPEPGDATVSPYPDLDDHLVTLHSQHGCALRLLTAGDRSDWASYANFVQSFDWADFYTHWGGGGFFEWLREELVARADLVLIDTRTGITEMGGVATRQMADVIIVLFAGNEENMASSARMAENFMVVDEQDRAGRPISVMMVPSRIDDSDSSEFANFHTRLTQLETLHPAALQDGYRVRDMLLPYRARLAFQEQLVIGNEKLETVLGPLVEGYNRIAANMQRLAPPDSRLRLGTGIAHGRVYLLAKPHQIEIDREIRRILGDRDFEVLPSTAGLDLDTDETELASSTCVLVLLDQRAITSRQLLQVMSHAERLAKPLIPVLLERRLSLPLALADVVPLDWSDPADRAPQTLLRAVRGTVPVGGSHYYVSYSRVDAEKIARRLSDKLIAGPPSYPVWLDVRDLQPGGDWDKQIGDAIRECQGLLFLMTEDSVRDYSGCEDEWKWALKYKKPIIPLRFDANAELPFRIASRQFIDFTAGFDAGLAKLRTYFDWLTTPAGVLRQLQFRFADAERELPRAREEAERERIKQDIAQLRAQIAEQQRVVADPAAAAAETGARIQTGIEAQQRPQRL
jgi:hypothetical protein